MIFFLIGMPGSGKSTLGKKLGQNLNSPHFDLDQVIEEREHLSIAKIFETKGEEYFRELESNTIKSFESLSSAIVSTGGGTPCFNNNMELMNTMGATVYLNISIATLVKRLRSEGLDTRPLLAGKDTNLTDHLSGLLKKRQPFYLQATRILSESDISTGDKLSLYFTS